MKTLLSVLPLLCLTLIATPAYADFIAMWTDGCNGMGMSGTPADCKAARAQAESMVGDCVNYQISTCDSYGGTLQITPPPPPLFGGGALCSNDLSGSVCSCYVPGPTVTCGFDYASQMPSAPAAPSDPMSPPDAVAP